MEKFDKDLLKILVCPKTGNNLIYDEKKNLLKTLDGKNTYNVKNGIPILVIKN